MVYAAIIVCMGEELNNLLRLMGFGFGYVIPVTT